MGFRGLNTRTVSKTKSPAESQGRIALQGLKQNGPASDGNVRMLQDTTVLPRIVAPMSGFRVSGLPFRWNAAYIRRSPPACHVGEKGTKKIHKPITLERVRVWG